VPEAYTIDLVVDFTQCLMPYTLWSHGRLLGHTDLDAPHFQDQLRHGFIQPTPLGEELLADAVRVFRLCAASRGRVKDDAYLEAFLRAVDAREAQHLMLRDESGAVFDCDFIRVYPTVDLSNDDEESDDWQNASAIDSGPFECEEEEFDVYTQLEDDGGFSEGEYEPDDIRWTTMEYFIQVFLKGALDAFAPRSASGEDATGSPA
jgi:hypothetical protein